MRFLLFLFLATALAGCTKSSGPLKTYFIGATRFTSGNRTAGAADTLAARIYVDGLTNKLSLTNLRVTVDYSPRLNPFVYPSPITSFIFGSISPSTEQLVYLDSTLAPHTHELLYTAVFGVRTATGTERWTFTATDSAGETSARTFVISQRRLDSTAVYNDYTLKLPVPATDPTARRFLDLEAGLALPGFTLRANTAYQPRIDVIVLPTGLTLASPDALVSSTPQWTTTSRSTTRFFLTTLTPAGFTGVTDATGLLQQFSGPGTSTVTGLATDQVYAFYITRDGAQLYGLMRVVAVPAGTTAGLQLEFRVAKPLK